MLSNSAFSLVGLFAKRPYFLSSFFLLNNSMSVYICMHVCIYVSSTYHFPVAGDTAEHKHPRGHCGASWGMMFDVVSGHCWLSCPEAEVAAAQ